MSTLIQEHLELGKKYQKLIGMYKMLENENKQLKFEIDSLKNQIDETKCDACLNKTCDQRIFPRIINGSEVHNELEEEIKEIEEIPTDEDKPKKKRKKKEENIEE